MPLTRGQIQKGAYLTSDGGAVVEASRPRHNTLPDEADPGAAFDGHIRRANTALDQLATLKAKKRERDDRIDLSWRVG